MDLVTTIIVQGWAEPALIDYAHAHGVRVLNTDGGDCYGDPGPIPWCANLSNATFRREQVRERGAKLAASPFDGFGFDFEHVVRPAPGVAPSCRTSYCLFRKFASFTVTSGLRFWLSSLDSCHV
eukprot:SAG31_NODE_66_length_28567_cov_30.222698_14_plen_124_part_00